MIKLNIVFLDAYTTNPGDLDFSPLENLGHCTFFDRTAPEELAERTKDAEIVIVNKFPINNSTLPDMPRVRYICVAATGYNNIDIEAVRKKNIQVSNVRDYSTNSVVQHVFASILAFSNRIQHYDHQVKKGKWAEQQDFCFYDRTIPTLSQKTLGIAGFGSIGQKVASCALAFGMKVLVFTRSDFEKKDHVQRVTAETLFSESDFLTLHMPLTEDTRRFVRKEHLDLMNPGSVIINTARGPLLDADDTLDALESGRLGAAFLDVWEQEPPKGIHPLMAHPDCVVTPHIAWAGLEARQNLLKGIVSNISSFTEGKWINRIYG